MKRRPASNLRSNAPLCTVFVAAFFALAIALSPICSSALADDARAEKLRQERQEVSDQLSGLKGKPAQMEEARAALVETAEYLRTQQIRLRGFQLWNAFVGFIGVANDSLQKVNPGSSVVTATAAFLQDRAAGAMANPDLQAKIRTLSDTVLKIGPALRQLDYAIKLDKQQVADLLVSRGMVDNTWWNRWSRNPEDVAESKAVVTGKITFIQERLGPAIAALEQAISEMNEAIPSLGSQVKALEDRIKKIDAELLLIEKNEQLNRTLEDARNIDQPQPVDVIRWPAEPKAYGAAFGAAMDAWQRLKSNSITPTAYSQLKEKSRYDAYAHMNQQLEPTSKAYSAASDYFWNVALPTRDSNTIKAALDRFIAAGNAYSEASKREQDLFNAQYAEPMKGLADQEKAEGERWADFARRISDLAQTQVDNLILDIWNKDFSTQQIPLSRIGLSGYGLAYAAWATAGNIGFISNFMGWSPSLYTLKGSGRILDEGAKQVQEYKDLANEVYSAAQSADSTFSGIASQVDSMGSELEPNRTVWEYTRWWWGYHSSDYYYAPNDLFVQINKASTVYRAIAQVQESAARTSKDEILEKASQYQIAASAMRGAEGLIARAQELFDLKKQAHAVYNSGSIDPSGQAGRHFLAAYGITEENASALEALVASLTTPETIEAHLFSTSINSKTYSYDTYRSLPRSLEDLAGIKQRYMAADSAAANAYNAYEAIHKQYNDNLKAMESSLASMRSQVMNVAPGLVRLLYTESVMKEATNPFYMEWTERQVYNWYPPDPQALPAGWPAAGPLFARIENATRAYNAKVGPYKQAMADGFPERAAQIDALARQAQALAGSSSIGSVAGFQSAMSNLRAKVAEIYDPLSQAGVINHRMEIFYAYNRFNYAMGEASARMGYLMQRDSVMEQFKRLVENSGRIISQSASAANLDLAANALADLRNGLAPTSALLSFVVNNEPGAQALAQEGREMAAKVLDYINAAKQAASQAVVGQVQAFYAAFAKTYQQRNAGAVVDLMDKGWSAPDGTDLVDVEEMLENSFAVFDKVEYKIENLSVTPNADGTASATYTVIITGLIPNQDLVHEERSTVSDVLAKSGNQWRIMRTTSGRFWK